MKIKFIQSGGFAGIVKEANIDTDKIPKDTADFFQDIITNADFFNLQLKDEQPMPDVEQIYITVEQEDKSHMISFSTLNIPEKLKPLVDEIQKQMEIKKF
ncbi:MAG: protealysin inhibitor emfourin [Candidatus Helarchaeota archaeon]